MTKKKSKTTASGIAFLRAVGTREKDPVVRNPDYLAKEFLSPLIKVIINIQPLVRFIVRLAKKKLPGGYYFHIARTKCIDDILEQQISKSIKQLVILGAGLDTRAYRFRDKLINIKVFEVDYPGTQIIKKERLKRLPFSLPSNISFVPLDFNLQGLDELVKYGYSTKVKTLFIWEGVCMYLLPEAVDNVFSFLNVSSGKGSNIVFDYIFQSMVEGKCDYYGAKQSSYYASKVGEPYLFGVEEGKIKEFLEDRKFNLILEYTPEQLEQTYLKRSDGTVLGKVYGYTNIAHAQS